MTSQFLLLHNVNLKVYASGHGNRAKFWATVNAFHQFGEPTLGTNLEVATKLLSAPMRPPFGLPPLHRLARMTLKSNDLYPRRGGITIIEGCVVPLPRVPSTSGKGKGKVSVSLNRTPILAETSSPPSLEALMAYSGLGSVYEECKTRENSNFLKKGKIAISVKILNFSRSRMMKRTSPLESSDEI